MVSIIVAAFNEEKNIERLLKSIKNQTIKNVETVIVDDGSTDRTIEIAKKYTSKVYARNHAERSVQRNFGVSRAKGKYVLILDADMELTPGVVKSCLENIKNYKALIVPEKTVGTGFMATIRKFEREMYMGDKTIEVARFFDKKIFEDFNGYDINLTGAEDYDLPKRIMDKYGADSVGWAKEWIKHHETQLTLLKQLKKKFYYAGKSVSYAKKHPDIVGTQGNMLFRPAYFRNWKKFLLHPLVGSAFIIIRILEACSAVLGYIHTAGISEFSKTFISMFRNKYGK